MVSAFPDITFIWKYERPEDDFSVEHSSKLSNLVLSEWMPQADILGERNWISNFRGYNEAGEKVQKQSDGEFRNFQYIHINNSSSPQARTVHHSRRNGIDHGDRE